MAEGKQLKFSFIVDEASLQKTRQMIRDLTADLSKLNEQAGRSGLGMGGSGGGVSVSGGGQRSIEQQRVVAKTAPVGRQLVEGFLNQKDIFKGIADGSKDSLRVMSESLKQAIGYQKREIKDLDAAAKHLAQTYDELGRKAKTWAGKPAMSAAIGGQQQQVGSEHAQILGERARAGGDLAKLQGMMSGGAAAGGPGFWTQNRSIPGLSGVMGRNTMLGSVAGTMGITPAMMGSLGLGAIGAWGVKQIGNQLMNAPNFQLRSDAAMGQVFGQQGTDIRGGEFRNIAATRSIMMDQNKRQDYVDLNSGGRRFAHSVGAFFGGDFNGSFSGRAANMAVMKAQQDQQSLQRQSDPLQDQILGEFQNYNSTLSMGRALHVGAPRVGPGQSGSVLSQIYKVRQSFPGFSDGEIAGALGTISSQGTRGGAYRMVGTALQGEGAGITGLAGSMGVMSRFGGGLNFGTGLRSMVGGGMDATTAGVAGQFLASQQAQLGMNLGARGNDFQGSGLMDMISTGAGGQGGRLIMDQNIRGAEYLQRSATGQTSPYQAARNVMIAMGSAPGLNSYGTSFLARKMSLTELADAANGKGGDVNDVFGALGGTRQMAQRYFKGHTQSLLEGVSASGLGDTSAGKLTRAMASSGVDPRTFFKKKLWKGTGLNEQQALKGYAGALQASDENMDPSQAMGLARDISGVGGGIRHGKAVGAPGGGSQEMELAKEHLKALTGQVEKATSAMSNLTASIGTLALRAELQGDLQNASPHQRAMMEQALLTNPKTRAEYDAKIGELDLVDQASKKTGNDRYMFLLHAGKKDPNSWMQQHGLGGRVQGG